MKRALVLVCLLASPATAQVSPYVNPYYPYANSTSGGTVQFCPYVSLDRLNLRYQSRTMPPGYVMMGRTTWNIADPNPRPAAFRFYPNYPSLNSALSGARGSGYTAAKNMQPRPLTAPRPVEIACDPYLDNDGCLSDYAGW